MTDPSRPVDAAEGRDGRRDAVPHGLRTDGGGDVLAGGAVASPSVALDGDLRDRNILVIAHGYDTFTKAQVDELAELVNEVHVYVRYNRLADLHRIVPLDVLEGHRKSDKVATDRPGNVHVHTTPVTYLPVDLWYRYLGPHHYAAVRRQLASNPVEFDLVHSHFTWSAGYVGARLGERYGVPSVLTVHENQDWLEEELAWGNDRLEWALRTQDAVVRVNRKDCERLSTLNDNVHAIPNGFDRDRFPLVSTERARRTLGLPLDADVVLSVGYLSPRKRFDRLIEAVSEIDHDGDLVCAICGAGEQYEELQRLAERHRDDLDVRLPGYVPDEELAHWMNACDVFALASEAEGNPTVMFEALGCGKPYVGTNVGGVDEVITSDAYGLYCPPDDMEGLVGVLEEGLRREWDRDAILQYAERYTWERVVEEVVGVYQSVWRDATVAHS